MTDERSSATGGPADGDAGPSRTDRWLHDYLGFTPADVADWFEPDEPVGTSDDDAPVPERIVSDPETLKAISDPTRLRILETMVTRARDAWSVKELAAALDVPQTRLYHHMELLAERELIRPAGQRIVSGIVETRYRVTALSLRLDPRLLASEDHAATTEALVGNVMDAARGELLAVLRTLPADPDEMGADRPLVSRGLARLTPARAAELRGRLAAVIEAFDDPEVPESRAYGFFLAFYPSPTAVPAAPSPSATSERQGSPAE
ncbi:MAG TPA: helix-turn-helix domain-containing protein [Candidatus Limnocylindrales bacterium]|jgi:DNA-binding transcriptional ArsR family regulator